MLWLEAEETALKTTKTIIAALLLLHLLVHPLIHAHALVGAAPATPELQQPGDSQGERARLSGPVHCMACRTGAQAVAIPASSALDAIPALSESVPQSPVSQPVVLFCTSLPARAPPSA